MDLIQSSENEVTQEEDSSLAFNYEQMLIKLEQDIRMHIKTEFQLKLYAENLESKIEPIESENINLKTKLQELTMKATKEINELKLQIQELNEVRHN